MKKVLIIEDDENMRDIYRMKFESEGFTVETADDGQEGIEKMTSFLPDLVLLDLMMPGMSGFDVLKNVKNNLTIKKIPIIVLSNINIDVQDLLKNWGAAYFFLKSDNTPRQVVEKAKMIINFSK